MLRNDYTDEPLSSLLNNPAMLAVVTFDGRTEGSDSPGVVSTGLIGDDGHRKEVWLSPSSVLARGSIDNCQYSYCHDYLFIATRFPCGNNGSVELDCYRAYKSMLNSMVQLGYNHLLRFWNYLPYINAVPKGHLENYQQFCVGRLRAFTESNMGDQDFPAASALGSFCSDAVFYALAGKSKGLHFENAQQQSAYRYPAQYGPSSPSFARATAILSKSDQIAHVFISGTASVIGHVTHAPNDLDLQLATTLENIDFLRASIDGDAELDNLKVYLRHQDHFSICQDIISARYPHIPAVYLHADICRSDLLVEIEAVCSLVSVKAV